MNWFPAIPDGAILRGCDLLERASSQKDFELALKAFTEAFHRGPPYFSVGVRRLLDGLNFFAHRQEGSKMGEIREMRSAMEEIALRADPNQIFTVLKLETRPLF